MVLYSQGHDIGAYLESAGGPGWWKFMESPREVFLEGRRHALAHEGEGFTGVGATGVIEGAFFCFFSF